MNSSSESISLRDGEPCSVTGVVGPSAWMIEVLRDLVEPCPDASVTHSSAFRFLS
jgi:hypothetical protein